jgi:hypothetical protein
MEISVLQSLIDRTSNQIAEYEAAIKYEKEQLAGWCDMDYERVQRKYTIHYYNQKLPKLRKIQKALKKEVAQELAKAAKQRFYDSM